MLNSLYLGGRIRAAKFKEWLLSDESGVSGIVAAVILVLIAVLLAALFWDRIKILFTTWFDKADSAGAGIGTT